MERMGKMKEKLKKIALFIANPRLLFCLGIAWMITNGWAYIALGIGTFWEVSWMIAVSGGYLALLWFPFTPEKILTLLIAIFLLKTFFPRDEKTLGVLKDFHQRIKQKHIEYKNKRAKKEEKNN